MRFGLIIIILSFALLPGCIEQMESIGGSVLGETPPESIPINITIKVYDEDWIPVSNAIVVASDSKGPVLTTKTVSGNATFQAMSQQELTIQARIEECPSAPMRIYAGEFQQYQLQLPCAACMPVFSVEISGPDARPLMSKEDCYTRYSDAYGFKKTNGKLALLGNIGLDDYRLYGRYDDYEAHDWGAPTSVTLTISGCAKPTDQVAVMCSHHEMKVPVSSLYEKSISGEKLIMNDTRAPKAIKIPVLVKNDDGLPIHGAVVEVTGPKNAYIRATFTDLDYSPDETDLKGMTWVIVEENEEFFLDTEGIVSGPYVPTPSLNVEIILPGGVKQPIDTEVKVFSADGNPLEGMAVYVSYMDSRKYSLGSYPGLSSELLYNSTTDRSGTATLTLLGGSYYSISVEDPLGKYLAQEMRIDATPHTQLDFYLSKASELRFTVMDADTGKPIEGASVDAGWDEEITDQLGNAAFTFSQGATKRIHISAEGYSAKSIFITSVPESRAYLVKLKALDE